MTLLLSIFAFALACLSAVDYTHGNQRSAGTGALVATIITIAIVGGVL